METTETYLQQPPWDALIAMINHRWLLQLEPTTTELVHLTSLGGTRTEIGIAVKRTGGLGSLLPPFEQGTYEYDRIDLTSYFGGVAPLIIPNLQLPVSTPRIAEYLTEQYGIVFEPNDFFHETLIDYDQTQPYSLTAHPNSLRWVGSLNVQIAPNPQVLANLITQTTLIGTLASHRPTGAVGDVPINGWVMTLPEDFTVSRRLIGRLKRGLQSAEGSALVSVLNTAFDNAGVEWEFTDVPVPASITNQLDTDGTPQFSVLYNGPVLDRWTPRRDRRHVAVIELNPAFSLNHVGHLLLHYD